MSPPSLSSRARRHAWFAASAAVAVALFAWVQTGGRFDLLTPESFCTFYDDQARSLVHRHLDVTPDSISGEAFIVDGRYYGYFGLTPAVLRLPLLPLRGEPGRWSRLFILTAFGACLLFAYRALLHVGALAGWPDAARNGWIVCPLVLGAGLGSTLFFLASRAYVYHEAIAVGAAFAMASAFYTLRVIDGAAERDAALALLCGILAVHARPPAGLFSLSFLMLASLELAWSARRSRSAAAPDSPRRRPLLWAGACLAAMLSLNLVSYLKFGTPDPHPLRYAVQYTPERRAVVDDRTFHLQNIPFNVDEYLTGANFALRPRFPFLFLVGLRPGEQRARFPQAKMDLKEGTLALPLCMPYLAIGALAGMWYGLAGCRRLRRTYSLLLLAVLPMALMLFSAIVVSQRFTADFCPFLIFTTAASWGVVEAGGRVRRTCARALVVALVALSIGINFLLAVSYQGEGVWGTPEASVQRYQRWKSAINTAVGE